MDVPLRIIGEFDAREIARGINGVKGQVDGLSRGMKTAFAGIITGAAIRQLFMFGESIDELSDNLETLNSIANGVGDALVGAMQRASDGDLSYRQSVGITIGAVQKLGLTSEAQIESLTMMGRQLAGLMRTDVGGAVTQIVDLLSSGRMAQLYRVIPDLKVYVDDLDKSLDALTRRNLIFNKAVELTKNLAAPGSNPFTQMKNAVADLADKLGLAIFRGDGAFARGMDAITTKIKELTRWVEGGKNGIDRFKASIGLMPSAATGMTRALYAMEIGLRSFIRRCEEAYDAVQRFVRYWMGIGILPIRTPGEMRYSPSEDVGTSVDINRFFQPPPTRNVAPPPPAPGGGGGGGGGGGTVDAEAIKSPLRAFIEAFFNSFDPNLNPLADRLITQLWNEQISLPNFLDIMGPGGSAYSEKGGNFPVKKPFGSGATDKADYLKFIQLDIQAKQDMLTGQEKVYAEFIGSLANTLGNFLKQWGWKGGKPDLMGLAQGVTDPFAKIYGGNLADFLGLGSMFAGPMAGLISGGIGFIANQIFGQDKPMTIEQPVDMRIVDINPRLANFFNFRGINVYSNRFAGVVEGGLW